MKEIEELNKKRNFPHPWIGKLNMKIVILPKLTSIQIIIWMGFLKEIDVLILKFLYGNEKDLE